MIPSRSWAFSAARCSFSRSSFGSGIRPSLARPTLSRRRHSQVVAVRRQDAIVGHAPLLAHDPRDLAALDALRPLPAALEVFAEDADLDAQPASPLPVALERVARLRIVESVQQHQPPARTQLDEVALVAHHLEAQGAVEDPDVVSRIGGVQLHEHTPPRAPRRHAPPSAAVSAAVRCQSRRPSRPSTHDTIPSKEHVYTRPPFQRTHDTPELASRTGGSRTER